MRILILGAGGVGGYLGGRLAEAGADVTFLVRPARKATLDTNGLVITSPLGDVRRPVRALLAAADVGSTLSDIVVLAPKSYDLTTALEAVAPAVGPGTAVLPMLNGVAHLETIAARLPAARPWGGVAHVAATLDADGTIRHLNRLNDFRFGPVDGRADPRAEALATRLATTPVTAEARPHIIQDLWDKLVFLATLAGATCLFRASIGTILETPGGRAAILDLFAECRAIATAEGYPTPAEAMAAYRAELTRPGSSSTASMLRDIERGHRTERAHILGDLLVRARRQGLATPMLALADAHVAAYERRQGV